MSRYGNNPQPDPRYFNVGNAFLGGIEQAGQEQRRNQLVDIERGQFDMQRQAFEQNQLARQAQGQQAQLGVEAIAAFLESEGLPREWANLPEDQLTQAIELHEQRSAPVQPDYKVVGRQLLETGPNGVRVAHTAPDSASGGQPVNQQIITRPAGNGLVQDFARDPRTGRRVPEGEPYKPVTALTGNVQEGERKAAALGTRLEMAMQELTGLETVAPGSSEPGVFEKGLEAIGSEFGANLARSSERQQADAAQLDALDAALTLATGAAYTREQLQNLRKSYFPQLGDTEETKQAKSRKFATIVETARIAAGRAEPSIDRAVGRPSRPGQQASGKAYADAEKERRYQEYKRANGG